VIVTSEPGKGSVSQNREGDGPEPESFLLRADEVIE
jgi:hypothetical protein